MARCVRFYELGGPEVLKIEEREVGEPGPGEVRVRMQAIGLNRAEVMFRTGTYLQQPKLPSGLGYEGAGVVEALGDGVTAVAAGDEVSIVPAFSMNDYGVYAERAVVPAHAVVKRPANVDAVHGSAVWMPYLTAYGALVDITSLSAGQAVLITAASSSVGLAAIQIANSIGAMPIVATRTQAKYDALRQAGAAHIIVTEAQDLVAEVERLTDGRGADVVFDPIAGPGVEALAQASAQNATVFLYGALSSEATPFPLLPALAKGLTLRGYTLFEIIADAERFARGKTFILEGLQSGDFKPTVAETFPFEEIVAAHRYMESNQQIGKIVVTVP